MKLLFVCIVIHELVAWNTDFFGEDYAEYHDKKYSESAQKDK
jgi:hypothetical protein